MDAEGDKGNRKPNTVWGNDAPQRPATANVSAPPAPRRQDAGLTQDGQLLEAGYGHGV